MDDPFAAPPFGGNLPRQRSRPNLANPIPAPPSSRSIASMARTPSPQKKRQEMTGQALRQHLQSLLEQKSTQLQTLGTMGQEILKQQQDLEERIREFEDADESDEEEIREDTRERLRELDQAMRMWENQNEHMMRGLGGKSSDPLEDLSPAVPSPSKGSQPNAPSTLTRRQRNAQHRTLDMEFATEIGQNLLVEVRRLQALLSERDRALEKFSEEKENWEGEKQSILSAVRAAETSVERYKEENWNLEVNLQELRSSLAEVQDQFTKSNAEQTRLAKTLVSTKEAAEAYKTDAEKNAQLVEELKVKHETDMAQARKTTAGLQRDKSDLLTELNGERLRRVSAGRGRLSKSMSASPGMLGPNGVEDDDEDVFAAGGKGNTSPTKRGPGFDEHDQALSPSQLYESDFDSPNPTPSKPFPRSPLGEMYVNEIDELRNNLAKAQREIEILRGENARNRSTSDLSSKKSVDEFGSRTPGADWEDDEGTKGASGRGRGSMRGRRGRGRGIAASIGQKLGFNRSIISTPGDKSFNSTSSGTPDLLRTRGVSGSPTPSTPGTPGGEALGRVLGQNNNSVDTFNSPSLSNRSTDSIGQQASFMAPASGALADEIGTQIVSSSSDYVDVAIMTDDWEPEKIIVPSTHIGSHEDTLRAPHIMTTAASNASIAEWALQTPKRNSFDATLQNEDAPISSTPAQQQGDATPTKSTVPLPMPSRLANVFTRSHSVADSISTMTGTDTEADYEDARETVGTLTPSQTHSELPTDTEAYQTGQEWPNESSADSDSDREDSRERDHTMRGLKLSGVGTGSGGWTAAKQAHKNASANKERVIEVPVERIVEVEKIVEVPVDRIVEVPVEKIVEVEKVVEVEKIVEIPKIVQVEKIVEKEIQKIVEVPVEKIVEVTVEKIVEVEKPVDRIVEVEKIVEVTKIEEKIVEVEKPVEVIKEVQVEKIVEKTVEIPKIVEVEKIVEKIVEVEKIIEKPVNVDVEKIVERVVEVEKPVEKIVEVPKIVEVEKIVEKIVQVPKEVEVIREVEVEKIVERIVEVIKEVEVEKRVEVPVEIEKIVEKIVEVPVEVEKRIEVLVEVEKIVEKRVEVPVEVEKIVEKVVEKIVEVPVEIEKVVEKIVERTVEVPVEVEKIVEKAVEVEKRVEVPVEKIVEVERIVEVPVERIVEVEKIVEVPVEKVVTVTKTIEVPVEKIVTIEKIIEVPAVQLRADQSDSSMQTEPLPSTPSSPIAPPPDISLFRVTPGTNYDFLKAPPAPGSLGKRGSRRVSNDHLTSGNNDTGLPLSRDLPSPANIDGLPPSSPTSSTAPDRTRPPTISLPPPPDIPPPPNTAVKKMSTGPPPRPMSPPPDDFMQRATTPTMQMSVNRHGSRTAPSSSAAAMRVAAGDMPPPSSAQRQTSRASFKVPHSVQSTPVRGDNDTWLKSRESVKRRATKVVSSSGYASASSSISGIDQIPNMHDRNPSMSSFDSYAGTVPQQTAHQPAHGSTDPSTIHAITQTMIGEYLYKYTRRTVGRGQSSNRHRRFFWVHPYTKTLYWSSEDPGSSRVSESSAKSVFISSVRAIEDPNVQPPGLFNKSIVVATPGREIQFTAENKERHDLWMSALQFLLQQQNVSSSTSHLAESSIKHNTSRTGLSSIPDEQGRLTTSHNLPKSPMSLRSFGSERQSLNNITPRAVRSTSAMSNVRPGTSMSKRAGTAAHEYVRRHEVPSTIHGGHRYKGTYKGAPIADQHDFDLVSRDDGDELDESFEGLENVRACCDGKHLVGDHHHHHDHPNVPKTPARSQTPSIRAWSMRSSTAKRPSNASSRKPMGNIHTTLEGDRENRY
ncbi:hypothetical protein V865_008424 [Kwoniella europaea PYCC6329]|uniref:PH domain-containing protein n=1 Tax=Kwoniella europaea PYCC6329 TaxID=1423913 RepID=A0AAX4KVY6_9TREE